MGYIAGELDAPQGEPSPVGLTKCETVAENHTFPKLLLQYITPKY